MKKKYEFTSRTRVLGVKGQEVILHEIKALIDIPEIGVKKGDLGGFIEEESNLSHEGLCWVSGCSNIGLNSKVYGNAQVAGWTNIFFDSEIFDNALISGYISIVNADVFGDTEVYGDVCISDTRVSSGQLADVNTLQMEIIEGRSTYQEIIEKHGIGVKTAEDERKEEAAKDK